MLVPIIRGWANYHRSVVARETFEACRQWDLALAYGNGQSADIQRKALFGLKRNTFKTTGHRHWVFATEDSEKLHPNGKPPVISLFCASDTPIKRHIQNQRRSKILLTLSLKLILRSDRPQIERHTDKKENVKISDWRITFTIVKFLAASLEVVEPVCR